MLWERVQPAKTAVVIRPELFVLAAVAYGVLYFSMGSVWLPGHAAFCTILIWVASLLGAEIARWLRLPRVVGMLGAGLLLANVPGGVVAAFPRKWGVQMRAAALATIFLRCGLELEFKTMNLYKWPALRLALVPGVIEALYDAGLGAALFGMPFSLAVAMGFILKAVGPGLVVPAMFVLQREGWGADKGVPSTVVIAASFDDIIAITGFSVAINIAIAGGENAAWQIASGPLQVLFGIAGGGIAGVVLGCTRVWDNKYKRLVGLYGAALLLMFFLEAHDMLSGGALGALFAGLVACLMWERGLPRGASAGRSDEHAPDIERVVAKVWNWCMEPLLFGTIGTSIVFAKLEPATIPKAVCIVLTGVTLRVLVTFFAMADKRFTWRERAFFAVAWTPKATVQASLSAVPLAMAQALTAGRPDHDDWTRWGNQILTTGVFAILLCGSLGTLAVFLLAPRLLARGEATPSIARVRSEARSLGKPSIGRPSWGLALGAASAEGDALGRPPGTSPQYSGALLSFDDLHGIRDHKCIDEYFDAIERLVEFVRAGGGRLPAAAAPGGREGGGKDADRAAEAQAMRLCDAVEELQERIDREVGPRQMTVRQMLHYTALRSRHNSFSSAIAPPDPRVTAAAAAAAAASFAAGLGRTAGGSALGGSRLGAGGFHTTSSEGDRSVLVDVVGAAARAAAKAADADAAAAAAAAVGATQGLEAARLWGGGGSAVGSVDGAVVVVDGPSTTTEAAAQEAQQAPGVLPAAGPRGNAGLGEGGDGSDVGAGGAGPAPSAPPSTGGS